MAGCGLHKCRYTINVTSDGQIIFTIHLLIEQTKLNETTTLEKCQQ